MNFYRISYRMVNGDINYMGVAAFSMSEACNIFEKHFDDKDFFCENPINIISCECVNEFRDMVLCQCEYR